MGERGYAVTIGDRPVGAGLDEQAHDLPVVRAAIAQDDRFHERGPAKVVDVIERRARSDQAAHNLDMAEMRGGDQRRSAIGARRQPRIVAELDGERHEFGIVSDGGDGNDIVGLGVQRVHIGAGPGQSAQRPGLGGESRDMGRGAAIPVAPVKRSASLGETIYAEFCLPGIFRGAEYRERLAFEVFANSRGFL